MSTLKDYRNGGEGFALWAEENCRIPVYPEGSSIPQWFLIGGLPKEYLTIWEGQKEVCKEALRMENGRFVHTLIVLCWPRGEGKSLLVCLIQLWKFFCWPKQKITLGANSKDQTKFVHFDIMKDIINNSRKLINIVGTKNVQDRIIRLLDANGNITSSLQPISTASGIVSNITGYTFSEFFDMKNPKFYVQLDGSVRNIPNALGLIDSTVSDKTHQLYKLFEVYRDKLDPTVFFSYRSSQLGVVADYWNPHMTEKQLNAYRVRWVLGDFERYFLNIWEAGARKIFTPEMIEATKYLGANGSYNNIDAMKQYINRKIKIKQQYQDAKDKNVEFKDPGVVLDDIENSLIPVESMYSFGNLSTGVQMCSGVDLERLGKAFDTGWIITAGFDRSDPMKTEPLARTIFTVVAKGLIGSLSKPFMGLEANYVPKYIYFLINIQHLTNNSLEEMKRLITEADKEYDGLDKITAESWGMFDLDPWCQANDIEFEVVHPGYEKQKAAFSELFVLYRDYCLKTPQVPIAGYKTRDVLEEEALAFDHDIVKRWFGSNEKFQKGGIQDDCIYSLGWNIWGSRTLGPEKLRLRKSNFEFGEMLVAEGNLGNY